MWVFFGGMKRTLGISRRASASSAVLIPITGLSAAAVAILTGASLNQKDDWGQGESSEMNARECCMVPGGGKE